MTDRLTPEQRSRCMSHIHSKDTKPEMIVRKYLFSQGYRYRLHVRKLPGTPDMVLRKYHTVIFVNGCFWHRCPHCCPSLPKTNARFWEEKFARNAARDARDDALLVDGGWTVIVVWECRLKKERLEPTVRDVILEVERAGSGEGSVARVIEIGSLPAWRLGLARRRLGRRRGRRGRA